MRTPTSQSYLKSVKQISETEVEKEYVGKFYSGTNFHQDNNDWYYTDVATTTKSAFLLQTNPTLLDKTKEVITGTPVFAATDTTYSGAGDGEVYNSSGSWSSVHDAVTGVSASYTGAYVYTEVDYEAGSYKMYRVFLPFDTSTLSDEADVTAASLNVYIISKIDQIGNYITVVQTFQASNTVLVEDDFDQCGDAIDNPTEGVDVGQRKDIGSISTSAYLTFTLNSTGVSWVSKTGYTKLGIRDEEDTTDGGNPTHENSNVSISSSEETGISQDPYLSITYTVPATILEIDGGLAEIDGGMIKID
jgi:hypothetical protein